jgi:hypothetical protein
VAKEALGRPVLLEGPGKSNRQMHKSQPVLNLGTDHPKWWVNLEKRPFGGGFTYFGIMKAFTNDSERGSGGFGSTGHALVAGKPGEQ